MKKNSTIKTTKEIKNSRNIVIDSIENFIETKNRYIQIVLLLSAAIAGIFYGYVTPEMQTIIRYTLVANIFTEMYILQAKDSIMQRKINDLIVDVNVQNGGLRFEEDLSIDENNFFDKINKDFFISGIAPSRFVEKYKNKLEKMLKNKKVKIYLLISSLDTVPENCAEYYGTKDDKTQQYDLLSKLSVVINSIENSKILKKALKEERLLLATSDIVFTTSFVAYNLFSSALNHSKIKITFYQQGEHRAGKLPSVILDSDKNIRDMYPYFKNIIIKQWNAAHIIQGEGELKLLSHQVLDLLNKCKDKE